MRGVAPALFYIERHAQCVILTDPFSVVDGPRYKTHAETRRNPMRGNSQLNPIDSIENTVRYTFYCSQKVNQIHEKTTFFVERNCKSFLTWHCAYIEDDRHQYTYIKTDMWSAWNSNKNCTLLYSLHLIYLIRVSTHVHC